MTDPSTMADAHDSARVIAVIDDALQVVALEQLDTDLFRNVYSAYRNNDHLFGGQVLAQALAATSRTVEDRLVHSLHGYFLRGGSARRPVTYGVERTRDGGRISTRRVVASQSGVPIFHMECSFRTGEPGFEHQRAFPEVAAPPEASPTMAEAADLLGDRISPVFAGHLRHRALVEVRLPDPIVLVEQRETAARQMWMRIPSAAESDDPAIHQQLLAYLSDFWLAGTALVPHPIRSPGEALFGASLDHALWFHRPLRVDEWLLYDTESPSASGATALNRGLLFDRAGRLVASSAQETLLRPTTPDAAQSPP